MHFFILFVLLSLSNPIFAIDYEGGMQQLEQEFSKPLQFRQRLSKKDWDQILLLLKPSEREDFTEWVKTIDLFQPDWKPVYMYSRPRIDEIKDKANQSNTSIVLSTEGLERQFAFFKEHEQELRDMEMLFGVNAEILVSIYYAETRLSTYALPHNCLRVVLTQNLFLKKGFLLNPLVAKPRREELLRYARWSLIGLFRYVRDTGADITDLKSSWAGACGPMQLMPYNFHYLHDGDRDGKVMVDDRLDSIAGAASFLKGRGYGPKLMTAFRLGKNQDGLIKMIRRYNTNLYYAQGVVSAAFELQRRLRAEKEKQMK